MKNYNFRWLVLVLVLAGSFQLQSCGGRKDADIQTEIASQSQSNADLAAVTATVVDGNVVLTGQCKDDDSRKDAEKAIKKIDGVKNITNNIMVSPSLMIATDDQLRENAKRILSNYKNIEAGISNGIITLRGEVKKDELQQLMMDFGSIHAKRIDNQLVIQ